MATFHSCDRCGASSKEGWTIRSVTLPRPYARAGSPELVGFDLCELCRVGLIGYAQSKEEDIHVLVCESNGSGEPNTSIVFDQFVQEDGRVSLGDTGLEATRRLRTRIEGIPGLGKTRIAKLVFIEEWK